MNNKIKVFRAMRNMTQEDLADKVGVARQTIIAMEKNKYSPSLDLAFRVAKALGEPIENIFSYE